MKLEAMNCAPQDSPASTPKPVNGLARRRLLKGGLASAPVLMAAVHQPVMATQCSRSPSQFASVAASPNGSVSHHNAVKPLQSLDTDFSVTQVSEALLELYSGKGLLASLGSALSSLLSISATGGTGPLSYSVNLVLLLAAGLTGVVTGHALAPSNTGSFASPVYTLNTAEQMLFLTLYLNLRFKGLASAEICLTAQDFIEIGQKGFIANHKFLGKTTDVMAYLQSLVGAAASYRVRVL